MKRKTAIIFVITFFMVSLSAFAYKYEETTEKYFKTGPEFNFSLENCNGDIEIVTYDGDKIYIKAEKYSNKEDDFRKTDVIFKESDRKLRVYVKRPGRNCKASVRFYIKMPHNISLTELRTVNGSIEMNGAFKDVNAKTVNGKVALEGISKDVEMETVNGSINLYYKKVIEGDIRLGTVNGSIKLELEKGSSFNLSAETVNGSIKTDYGISVSKKFIGSEMEGSVNKGKFDIKTKTVNGSIKILEN